MHPNWSTSIHFSFQYLNDTRHQSQLYDRRVGGADASPLGNTLSPQEFSQVEVRMQNRLDYLAKTCSQYGLDKPGKTIFIRRKYPLIWRNDFY